MDVQVARREDARLRELLDRFVIVRAVEMEGIDLSLFQFDYDQTWHAFFLNADRAIYGRYGTRGSAASEAGIDVSLPGFLAALEGALEIHAGYPANRASLAKKKAPRLESDEIRGFPLFRGRFAGDPPKNCAHCHHVFEAVRSVPRAEKKPLPDALLWPFPKPDRVGLTMELDARATVKSVLAGSTAERAGFRAGDGILSLDGQPVISIADIQWVLQQSDSPCTLRAEVQRGPEKVTLSLALAADWRKGEDISWRTSTRPLRPFGWIAASAQERAKLGVKDGALAARVAAVPKNSIGQRAGLQVGDMIVAIDGRDDGITENEWFSFLYQRKLRGQDITLTILRDGKHEKVKFDAP